MKLYDFKSLSDIEFEEFAKDVLVEHTQVDFKTFRKGRDKGIDLIGIVDEGNVIVQVKHYANSSFSNLRTAMKIEIEKMKIENPFRYILFTSMDLSVKQCREIIEIMDGYIFSEKDIYDNKRINSIIMHNDFFWIQEKYYKLWLSDVRVINRILHNAQINNLEFLIQKILENLKLYVYTNTFHKAKEIVESEGLIIITGEPGVGKTVLANLLVLNYIEDNYDLKFVSGNNLHELESILSVDSESKEIIFLDDFLGSNFIELIRGNNENRLVSFLRKYLRKKNKRVVLTTRTSIYNKAITNFERLNSIEHNLSKLCLELNSYNKVEKAKILYNHCYFNLENKEYFYEIVKDNRYKEIINHVNYNPRIIEFFTDSRRIMNINTSDYYNFIIEKLSNPNEIWKYEYESKISDEERFILDTVMSLNGSVDVITLEQAFDRRYQYEIVENKSTRVYNAFQKSLQVLTSSFLKITIPNIEKDEKMVSFINPSVLDFMINYYNNNYSEQKRLVHGINYIDQLSLFNLFEEDKSQKKVITPSEFLFNDIAILIKKDLDEIYEIRQSKLLFLGKLISNKFKYDKKLLDIEAELVNENIINMDTISLNDFFAFLYIVDSSVKNRPSRELILKNLEDIILSVIEEVDTLDDYKMIIEYISRFKPQTLENFLKNKKINKQLIEIIEYDVDSYCDETIIDNFDFTDYIYQDGPYSYDFDKQALKKEIDCEIENIINHYCTSIGEQIGEYYFWFKKDIIETLSKVNYGEFINEVKVISHFESAVEADRYYEDDFRDRTEYIGSQEDSIITDLFEGRQYRD